ncbi:hypothetical protein D3C75_860590 [compost metagenome]
MMEIYCSLDTADGMLKTSYLCPPDSQKNIPPPSGSLPKGSWAGRPDSELETSTLLFASVIKTIPLLKSWILLIAVKILDWSIIITLAPEGWPFS